MRYLPVYKIFYKMRDSCKKIKKTSKKKRVKKETQRNKKKKRNNVKS